jgi:hypothetical protein
MSSADDLVATIQGRQAAVAQRAAELSRRLEGLGGAGRPPNLEPLLREVEAIHNQLAAALATLPPPGSARAAGGPQNAP